MTADVVLVCTACGSPSCWDGEFMCEAAAYAGVAPCTCDWSHNRSGPTGAHPLIINPGCEIHGEPS
jgi:hypothetical protein